MPLTLLVLSCSSAFSCLYLSAGITSLGAVSVRCTIADPTDLPNVCLLLSVTLLFSILFPLTPTSRGLWPPTLSPVLLEVSSIKESFSSPLPSSAASAWCWKCLEMNNQVSGSVFHCKNYDIKSPVDITLILNPQSEFLKTWKPNKKASLPIQMSPGCLKLLSLHFYTTGNKYTNKPCRQTLPDANS